MSPRIPVVVVTAGQAVTSAPGDVTIALQRPLHQHESDKECPACAAIGDVRVALYELLETRKSGSGQQVRRVIVDAGLIADVQPTLDRITGVAPATAMRDHVVARAFELAEVI